MFKKLAISTSIIALSLTLIGCKERHEVVDTKGNDAYFTSPSIVQMPKLRNSQKRGFSDFNCDGIEDMIEINDDSSFFSMKDDYKIKYFQGVRKDGHVEYLSPKMIPIKVNLSMFKDAIKIDTADLNGDQCADVVFTSVIQRYRKPTVLQMKVAMNVGELKFLESEHEIKMVNDNRGFQYWFHELVREISYDEESSIYDYLKMDWADWDGNGYDDLILFVKDQYSLDVGIFFTEKTSTLTPVFTHMENEWLDNFLYGYGIRGVDTGDITGNGCADVIIAGSTRNETLDTAFMLNRCDSLEIHESRKNQLGVKTDFFSKASKRDLVDENGDGKDDIIYITEMEDNPVKFVFLSDSK